MTKEQYEQIANAIRNTQDIHDVMSRGTIAEQLAEIFDDGNPTFNKAAFLNACGLN